MPCNTFFRCMCLTSSAALFASMLSIIFPRILLMPPAGVQCPFNSDNIADPAWGNGLAGCGQVTGTRGASLLFRQVMTANNQPAGGKEPTT